MIKTQLEEITLENFQAIKDRVTIPIKPITILVGPNSAGKSSIYDAIEILKLIFEPDQKNLTRLNQYLRKWARLEKYDLKSLSTYAPDIDDERLSETTLGLKIKIDHSEYAEDILATFSRKGGLDFDLPIGESILEIFISFQAGAYNQLKTLKISLNDKKFLDLKIERNIEKNTFNHKVTIDINLLEGFLYLDSSAYLTNESKDSDQQLSFDKNAIKFIYSDYANTDDQIHPRFFLEKESCWWQPCSLSFFSAYDAIFNFIQYFIYDTLYSVLPKVEASRSLPNSNQTVAFFNANSSKDLRDDYEFKKYRNFEDLAYRHQITYHQIEKKINEHLNPHWEWITKTLTLKKMVKLSEDLTDRAQYSIDYDLEACIDKLNKYLSDELFHDNGYQLVVDLMPMVSENTFPEINFKSPVISKLFLINSIGIKHEIEDVGSGIGYIIPVLASLVAGGSPGNGGLVCIQQPELHIHPALQSSLAEIFTDAIEDFHCNQIIIETHSEHLILRLLKLVRTRKKRALEKNRWVISANDISVIYFQPDINTHSTKINPLRISEDGSFIDEWPNGFFIERYKDIFDE
jgi:predicted ATPase